MMRLPLRLDAKEYWVHTFCLNILLSNGNLQIEICMVSRCSWSLD